MKKTSQIVPLILAALLTWEASADQSGTPFSSVTCDSMMRIGFLSGNERGIFTYTAKPFSVTIQLGATLIPIDDNSHICTIPSDASDLPFQITSSGDLSQALSVQIDSKHAAQEGNDGDGGFLLLNCPTSRRSLDSA